MCYDHQVDTSFRIFQFGAIFSRHMQPQVVYAENSYNNDEVPLLLYAVLKYEVHLFTWANLLFALAVLLNMLLTGHSDILGT